MSVRVHVQSDSDAAVAGGPGAHASPEFGVRSSLRLPVSPLARVRPPARAAQPEPGLRLGVNLSELSGRRAERRGRQAALSRACP